MTALELASQLRELSGFEEEWIARAVGTETVPVICHDLLARCLGPAGDPPLLQLEVVRALSLAERDWLLLQLRERSLGAEIRGEVRCAACERSLEVRFNTLDVSFEPAAPAAPFEVPLPSGCTAVLRPLTAGDHEHFASLVGLDAQGQTRAALSRAVVSKERSSDDLSPEDRTTLENALQTLNPEGIRLDLECDHCGKMLTVPFDVCGFLLAEIRENGKSLLDDVHRLARTYHWSETEILRLPVQRRLSYLMRIEAEMDRALVREEIIR